VRSRLVLLVAAVLLAALAVVEVRYLNRARFAQLQDLQVERDAYVNEWGRLLLEEGAWSQHKRIEATARARLGMDLPDPKQIVVVRTEGAAHP
jgi:cell division protein FtsL